MRTATALTVVFALKLSLFLAFANGNEGLQPFLEASCYDCHSGAGAEAGLDLTTLPVDLGSDSDFATWVRIHDRVRDGEMPPPDDLELEPSEAKAFLNAAESWLTESQLAQQQAEGRVRGRRLTNVQLERTLHDLLGIDIPLEREMPEEPRTGRYSTLADRQSISHFALEQHLKVIDLALDEAFRRALSTGDEWERKLSAEQISRTRTRTREPEYIDGGAVVWSGKLAFYGRMPATAAREPGWYRFRFGVQSLKQPKEHGVWCTVRSGQCVSSAPLMAMVDAFEATEQRKEVTVVAWLPEGHMLEIRPSDATLKMAKFAGGQSANGEGGMQNVPGIRIDGMLIERIHLNGNDDQVRQSLFGEHPVTTARRSTAASVRVDDPLREGKLLLRGFAKRAFRRAVDATQMGSFEQIFADSLSNGDDFPTALRAAYRAILCSARFLYFQESPGKLDDFAIASRLSYLLWGTMPDAELFRAANSGELSDPKLLKQQTRRMLEAERGSRFMVDFAREWLELRDIDFTEPDQRMFPEFDPTVQAAMLHETHEFLQTLLDNDMSVRSLIDCDFTFLNSRLARYYGIEDVRGDELQQVVVEPETRRGGLLSQGSILKVTANGTNTSPVLRGVWVADRILGQTIPPPPSNVPAIEPDVRGAKSIREQLAKHRDHAECAACHNKIDPPGFALENFDPAGRWRDFYPRVEGGRVKKGTEIDASFVTSNGRPFADFDSFKQLIAEEAEPLARNLAEQLLCYGTGAEISFADRREIDRIARSVRPHDYGVRSIVEAAVTSQIFLSK